MKKLMVSTIIILPLLILAIMLVSGAIMSFVTHIYVESVEFVENETLVLVMNDEQTPPSQKLEVNVLPWKAKNRELIYTAADENIAAVDQAGVVTAKYYGETYITVASAENRAATATRKVIVTDLDVHAVTIKEYRKDMYRGESQKLLAEVLPHEAANKNLVWRSSDDGVLSVTQSGEVTCKSIGSATITVTSVDRPEISATAEIRCHEPLQGISADQTPVVTARTSEKFPAIVPSPANATYTVQYSSSNEEIAEVDEAGEISFYRAGSVLITATAADGAGNSYSVSVKYDCTYGYYAGSLFARENYPVDYDSFAGRELEIGLQKTPAGSDREILSAEIDRTDLISFDKTAEKFTLKAVGDDTPLGPVKIMLHAKKYSEKSGEIEEFDTDVCTVTITRNTQDISFVEPDGEKIAATTITADSITLTEELSGGRPSSGLGVLASPANRTDTLSYALEQGGEIARLNGKTLEFSRTGEAVVAVTAGGGTVKARLFVTYVKEGKTEKIIPADGERRASLNYEDGENFQTGILQFTTPEGYTAHCVSSDDEIVRVKNENGIRLVPGKGGFATITVNFEPDGAAPVAMLSAPPSVDILIYVDRRVAPANLGFDKADGYMTSREEIGYAVELNVPADAMEGKEIFVCGEKKEFAQENGKLVVRMNAAFGSKSDLLLTVSVRYAERIKTYDAAKAGELCKAECTLHSTHGDLSERCAPTVTCEGKPLSAAGNSLVFTNIGDKIVLNIDVTDPVPHDFILSEDKIKFTTKKEKTYFSVDVAITGNSAAVTLTALEGTYGKEEADLRVAGHSFGIVFDIGVLADKLTVKYGGAELAQGQAYSTFLSSLDLTVQLSRLDGKPITEASKTAQCFFGDVALPVGRGDVFSVTIEPGEIKTLSVQSGAAEFTCTIAKCELSGLNFEFCLAYSDNGRDVTVGPFSFDEERVDAIFPQAMQGSFDLRVTIADHAERFLGGFDEKKAEAFFALDPKEGWDYRFTVSGLTSVFTVTPPQALLVFAGEELTVHSGAQSVTLALEKADLQRVEFTGYDSRDPDDVYPGYQQVRVFAKQSYYQGEIFDYYRIPLIAERNTVQHTPADLTSLVWTLTRYNDRAGTQEVVAAQRGTKLLYGGQTYTIEDVDGCSTLMLGETVVARGGKYVADADRVPWVDVFAKNGFADIYFGNIAGLTESDVQNDYFGNFGEKAGWQLTPRAADDGSQRTFEPSENAYSFLRVEASDGAKDSSASAHFNFNLLEGGDLVNVFDAAGYYANQKIVLHTDLYGPGELGESGSKKDEAERKGLFLNVAEGLGKTMIYGNGCQVNLQAKNAALSKASESDGVTIDHAYNAIIKCSNPDDTISSQYQKMVLKMSCAYYCGLSYYYKFNPTGGAFYTKNTVFSYVPKAAIQLSNNETMYAENMVIVECGAGILVDNSKKHDPHIYFRGKLDILNYSNRSGLMNLNSLVGAIYDSVLPNIKDYLEWHEKTFIADGRSPTDPNLDKLYVNVLMFAVGDLSSNLYVWKDSGYTKAIGTPLENGAKLVYKELAFGAYFALTYETLDENGKRLDNATIDVDKRVNVTVTADINQLFTEKRYIRLPCEYKNVGEKNYDHIKWHMQQVYRDLELQGLTEDHITNLRNSLKNASWGDVGVDDQGEPYDRSADISELLSAAILPEKREYE